MRLIRKAVLLAAGRGARLGALTEFTPKPLLEVAGRPLLGHILHAFAQIGIKTVLVISGHLGDQVESFCARFAQSSGLAIRSIRQPQLDGTGGAMLAAAPELAGEERFLFGWGDILMDPENYPRFVVAAQRNHYDLMMMVNRVDDPYRGGAVYVDDSMRVTRIVEKPARGTSSTNWNNAGLFCGGASLLEYARRLRRSERGELELPQAIAAMVADGLEVRAVEVRGLWSDVGTPEDLALARQQFGSR